jgi:glycosyltransferase involved in cell wall biosynthesis
LYAGRIEPRKNVLGLIQAAAIARLPLVIIGAPTPGQEAYWALCRAQARSSAVRFLDRMAPEDPRLAAAFDLARVVALPSWFETPGLFALEGALAGAAVVITPFGSTREYFGSLATYAPPGDPNRLARALENAWHEGPPPQLRDRIRSRFLWSQVARKTAEVYDHLER